MNNTAVDDLYTYGLNRVARRNPIRRLVGEWFPEYLIRQIGFELKMVLTRLKTRGVARRFRGRTDMLVNAGAGDTGRDGWINIDASMAKGITSVCDVRRYLPFEDGSVKAIFTEHVFEHLDYTEEAPRFLSESFRVLKEGGIIRIVVPDIEKYLNAYADGGWEALSALRPLELDRKDYHYNFRYSTRAELINVLFRQFYEHKFMYDFETLKLILERNGFSQVRKQAFGKSMAPEICIDLEARASESLYVEAVKKTT